MLVAYKTFKNSGMKFLLVLVLTFGAWGYLHAQMTDAEVIEAAKAAHAQGKTQQEIVAMLVQKGVTEEQVLRIKANYEREQGDQVEGQASTVVDFRQRGNAIVNSTSEAVAQNAGPARVFGRELFNNSRLTFVPNLNIPTPPNYKLGPGDEIIIDIWGDSQASIRQYISPEGSITVDNIGPIYLVGKSVKEANDYLRNVFGRIYADLIAENPKTFLKVTLGEIRSIHVNIMGEVTLPGTYTLSSLATLFHALYAAGGVSDLGSLRNVIVYRGGKKLISVDVYKFIMEGDDDCNIALQDGDNISVPPYEELVSVIGRVKRPMRYELKEGESLKTLFDYAGGFTSDAYKKNVNVKRQGETEFEMYTVYKEEYPSFILTDGDEINVGVILDKFSNRVSVAGAVFRPGDYALTQKIGTVKQLINIAEGITEDAFLNRVILYREKEDLTQEMLAIDLGKLLRGEIEDISLRKNDRLYIPSRNSLREAYQVTIHGAVKNPQTFPYVENMTLEDAVIYAGGLLEAASEMRIDVARRIKDPKSTVESPVESELFSFPLKDGLMIDGVKDFVLQPFDEVYVRRSPGYRTQQNVRVEGEVLYPGVYAKETTNERISDLIRRAGGITSQAYVKGARLIRRMNADELARVQSVLKVSENTLRDSTLDSLDIIEPTYLVGIDLAAALDNPGGESDLVLREGDVIHVSNYINTVKISGEVMFPNAVTYEKKLKLKDYIANAGGFGMKAKKRKVFVVYQNGTVATRKGGRMPKIEPGCEIIVPRKPERRNRLGLPEIMSLTSSTTSIAAMITSILNSTK